MKRQSGFTLIELVVVIVVLGILAATAAPKFMDLQTDSRIAALKGIEGAMKSAVNLSYSKAVLKGIEKESTVTKICPTNTDSCEDINRIHIKFGKPAADHGIVQALDKQDITYETNCKAKEGESWCWYQRNGEKNKQYMMLVNSWTHNKTLIANADNDDQLCAI